MDRRAFLKGLAAVMAAPIVAKASFVRHEWNVEAIGESTGVLPLEIGSYENVRFIATHEYGNAIQILSRGIGVEKLVEKTKEILFEDARKTLPKGTRFVILDGGESDFGFRQNLAWYYSPKGNKSPVGKFDPLSGRTVICEAVA